MCGKLCLLLMVTLSVHGTSSKEVLCVSDVAFTIITEIFNNSVDINVRLYCPMGFHCVSNTDSPCQPNYIPSSTPAKRLTTAKALVAMSKSGQNIKPSEAPTSVGEPINCHGSGYHRAAKCNEYIECAPLYLWFRAELKTCKEGYFYSEANKPCSMPPNVVCTD